MHRHPRLEEFIWWTPLGILCFSCFTPILVQWERWEERDGGGTKDGYTTPTPKRIHREMRRKTEAKTERERDYGGDWSTPAPAPWNCCPVHITIAEPSHHCTKGGRGPRTNHKKGWPWSEAPSPVFCVPVFCVPCNKRGAHSVMRNPNYIDTLLSITDASNGLTCYKQIIGIRSQSTNLFQDYPSECKVLIGWPRLFYFLG